MWFLHERWTDRHRETHDNGYWLIDTDEEPVDGEEYKVYNAAGGYHYWTCGKQYPDEQNEVVVADGWDDLDNSALLTPTSRIGWLAPDGTFYGCQYWQHNLIAERVIRKTEIEMENEGWVKMYKSQLLPFDPPDYYICRNSEHPDNLLTEAQVKVLDEKGYTVRPWDMDEKWHEDY